MEGRNGKSLERGIPLKALDQIEKNLEVSRRRRVL